MKSLETYKLGVVLEVDGKRGLATIELNDKALQKLHAQAEKTGKGLKGSLGDGLREVGSNLANIKAGLDIARDVSGFIFGLAKGAADAGSKFHDLSIQTGLSVETFSGLELQLKQSGTDMDALARATVIMQRNLGEAASGNKDLQRSFAALGVRDVRAALLDTDATLRTVAKSLGEAGSAGERNAEGAKVMGRGFKELSVFLEDTHGDLGAVIEQARRAGQVMSDEAAEAADAFGDQLDALTHASGVAARSFGMELVPELTRGMQDVTGALGDNSNEWRNWGRGVADVMRGVREAARSEVGTVIGWIAALGGEITGVSGIRRGLSGMGAQSRAGDAPAQTPSPWQAIPLAGGVTRPDFFAPGGGGRKAVESAGEKARKKFVDTLHEWAETFNIPRSALRAIGSQSKVHRGWAHRAGMATDIDPKYMTPAAIEGARRMGLNVIPELYKGNGPNGYSTGPHYHIQAMTKAAQAESKVFEEQVGVLDSLARKLAEAESSVRALSQSAVEQELASTRMSLGLHKLEGPTAELAESMMQQLEAELKAADAGREHAEALESLKGIISSTSAEVFGAVSAQDQMTAALRKAEVPLASYAGQWARLLATMKDVGDLTPTSIDMPAAPDFKLPDDPYVDPATNGAAPPPPKPNLLREAWKEFSTLGDETARLKYAFVDLANSMRPQGQAQGGKRGFFSKLLGVASPFLNLIPGVGPILSLAAGIGSRALAGDYAGAVMGAAGGFASGGAFRSSGGSNASGPYVNPGTFTAEFGAPPPPNGGRRALGGPVSKGRAYTVGDRGPRQYWEVFEPEQDGYVYPSVEAYEGGRRGGGGGGGHQGAGLVGGVLASVLNKMEAHFARLDAADPDSFFTTAAKRNPGAVTEAFMTHGSRDPKVIEWMERRRAA